MSELVVVDCSNLAYRAMHALGGRISFRGEGTGIIHGFLSQVLLVSKIYGTRDFVFCWDSKHSKRRKVFPEYKPTKKRTEEERELYQDAQRQIKLLRRSVIPRLGFKNSWVFPGYEADDLIAVVAQRSVVGKVVLLTSDHDLHQCLSGNVCIFHTVSREERGVAWLRNAHGCTPEEYTSAMCIAGCNTDGVPGVAGVGIPTALKYLRGELKETSKTFQKIEAQTKIARRRTRRLVCLPYSPPPPVPELQTNALQYSRFLKMCLRFGFDKMAESEEWRRFFDCGVDLSATVAMGTGTKPRSTKQQNAYAAKMALRARSKRAKAKA